ncbi:MAG TPA: DoxX family protein [Myxococcales bacterium]|nr:DoxX family protein [Myxococcales bacterium]
MAKMWVGRVIAWLVALLFAMSAVMKLLMLPAVVQGMEHLGLPQSLMRPLGVIELLCAVVYLVPRTSFVGAILLTGYVGGTIITHWRIGEPPFVQIVVGLLIWLSFYLRRPRFREVVWVL